jgi:hypothetical protein
MTTGTKIVQGALSRIGAHSIIRPAGPEAIDTGKDTLNSMIAEFQDDEIDIGAVPLEAVGDELSEPLGLTNTIMDMLAVRMQPLFPGLQISNDLRVNANKGHQNIIVKYQAVTIPKPQTRETLPMGQGNKNRNNSFEQTFFDDGDTIG